MTTNAVTKTPDHFRPAVSLKASDLADAVSKTIKTISDHVKENNLTVTSEDKMYSGSQATDFIDKLLNIGNLVSITKMTKSAKKKLVKRMRNANYKLSTRSMNTFISFARNKMNADIPSTPFKITPSQEEQAIIVSRTKYNDLKILMEAARIDYRSKKKVYKESNKKYFGS